MIRDKQPMPPFLGFVIGALALLALTTTLLMHGCDGWDEPVSSNQAPNRVAFVTDSLNNEAARMASQDGYQAVKVTDFYVFVHPRGNADRIPGSEQTYDHKNLQKGLNWAQNQGRELRNLRAVYHINRGVRADITKPLNFDAGFATWQAKDGGEFTMLYNDHPADMNQAHQAVERKHLVRNLRLKGQGNNQNGIELGPSYGSRYEGIYGENLNWNIYSRFEMNGEVSNCFSTNSTNGWAAGTLLGVTPGSTWSNSQSNSTRYLGNRWYGNSTGTVFLTEHSSGIIYDGNIAEGVTAGKAFEMHAPGNTVVKDWTIRNSHIELVDGASIATFYARWAAGIITIDKAASGTAAIFADIASTPGYTQVTISNIPWWVPRDGKAFNNQGNTSWRFINCDNQLHNKAVLDLFKGRAVREGCDAGGGYDQVCIQPINR